MIIRKNLNDIVYTLGVDGRIDMLNSAEFQQAAEEGVAKVAGKNGTLVIDFGGLKYISSAGLRVILSCQKQLTKTGGKLKIINVLPAILEIFEITGFTGVVDISGVEVKEQ